MGPDGALYISDYKKGRIWRVIYTGEAAPADGTMGSMPADTTGVPPAGTAADSSFTGAALFRHMECATCHTVDPDAPASPGPSLFGLYGIEVDRKSGVVGEGV